MKKSFSIFVLLTLSIFVLSGCGKEEKPVEEAVNETIEEPGSSYDIQDTPVETPVEEEPTIIEEAPSDSPVASDSPADSP